MVDFGFTIYDLRGQGCWMLETPLDAGDFWGWNDGMVESWVVMILVLVSKVGRG